MMAASMCLVFEQLCEFLKNFVLFSDIWEVKKSQSLLYCKIEFQVKDIFCYLLYDLIDKKPFFDCNFDVKTCKKYH